MQVLAFTAGGDGVRSVPIHCQTEQDGTKKTTYSINILYKKTIIIRKIYSFLFDL
jgi:hypothetical protein